MDALWLVLFMSSGVTLIALSIPMALGKVPPNNWYGFRTRKTLADEKVWYEANRVAGRGMVAVGVLLIVLTPALFLLGKELAETTKLIVIGVVVLAALAVVMIRSFVAVSRM